MLLMVIPGAVDFIAIALVPFGIVPFGIVHLLNE